MCLPPLLRQPHALRAKAALGEDLLRLAPRDGLDLGIPALCEIPEPLAVTPADDRYDTAPVEDLEQQRDVAVPVPAVRRPGPDGAARDLSRQQRPRLLELAENGALVARVRLQELVAAALVRVLVPSPPPHPGVDERQILHRPDEGDVLEQLLLLPEQPVQLGSGRTQSRAGSTARGAGAAPRSRWGRSGGSRGCRTVSSTDVAEPSSSCARTAIRRASSGETILIAPPARGRCRVPAARARGRMPPRAASTAGRLARRGTPSRGGRPRRGRP